MFHRLCRRAVVPILAALLAGVSLNQAVAQGADQSAIKISDIESLIKTLENDDERKAFVKKLKDLVAAQKAAGDNRKSAPSFVDRIVARARASGQSLAEAAAIITNLPHLWRWGRAQFDSERQRDLLLRGLWKTLLALLAGLIAEWLVRLVMRGPRRRIEDKSSDSLVIRAGYLAVRTVMDLVPIAALAAAAYLTLPLTQPSAVTSEVALPLILSFVLARAILGVARMVLVPKVGSLRLVPLKDETAAYLFVWTRRLTNFVVYAYFGLIAITAFGLPEPAFEALQKFIGLVVTVMLIVFVLQNRKAPAEWLAGNGDRSELWHGLSRRIGDIWHVLAIIYIVACFVIWLVQADNGFGFLFRATLLTGAVIVISRLLILGLRRALDRLFRIDPQLAAANPRLEERANRYVPVIRVTLAAIVNVIALLAILQVWGLDIVGLLATDAGRRIVSGAVTIFLILVVAVVVWELINGAIDRYMARLADNQRAGARAARMRTLLPMMEKAILAAIVLVASFTILSELGVNIGPLLAGAGVLGLAIGFGAQTLVKDIITGIFNILEDTMAVGDFVTVADRSGTVEDLSIRSVVLRDYSGTQHTIPFSSITDVQNLTKDFSYAVMDIGVAYRESVDKVTEVIREIGAELRTDETFGPTILDDMEIAGLQELGDSAVVIRARFRCAAGSQWGIRREMNRRVKNKFDELGIEIPFPHTTIFFGEDSEGRAPPAHIRVTDATPAIKRPTPDARSDAAAGKSPSEERSTRGREAFDPAVDND